MHLIIVFSPLFGSAISGLFAGIIGRGGSVFISSFSVAVSFFFTSLQCMLVACGDVLVADVSPWIVVDFLDLHWCFLFDGLTFVILFVVTTVSLLVHIFSGTYIYQDPHLPRFICYLSLFTFFIIILVTSENFVQIFVGWEGVGLCSFLLINFWFTRVQANKAAIKAMLVNRVGDFGLVIGILVLVFFCGSLDYASVFSCIPFMLCFKFCSFFCINAVDLAAGFLFIGAVGKSAQLGLHTWLPDAIEGPTPVSALIHAATMVTAGVFLLVRCSAIFERSPIILFFISCLGACTAFFAATTGLVQNDLKKVIAYSTCSQLGYIVFSCGFSAYSVGLFHLTNHAFFKALLFLCAGSVIHALGDEQDLRKMGGLVRLLPLTYSAIVVGSLALLGFPFLSGFYSKDLILEAAAGSFSVSGHFAFFFGSLSAFFTAFYSVRLLFLTFFSPPQGFRRVFESVHEASFPIVLPLVSLCFGSIFSGFFFRDFIVGPGTAFFGASVFIEPGNFSFFHGEFIPFLYKLGPLFLALIGCFLASILFSKARVSLFLCKRSFIGSVFFNFLNRKWLFDKIFHALFSQPYLFSSLALTYHQLDRGILELFGPFGFSFHVYRVGFGVSRLQSGEIYHYLLVLLVTICTFSCFLVCFFG